MNFEGEKMDNYISARFSGFWRVWKWVLWERWGYRYHISTIFITKKSNTKSVSGFWNRSGKLWKSFPDIKSSSKPVRGFGIYSSWQSFVVYPAVKWRDLFNYLILNILYIIIWFLVIYTTRSAVKCRLFGVLIIFANFIYKNFV